MSIKFTAHEGQAKISVSDNFSFPVHREFRKACDEALEIEGNTEIVVDLGGVRYMDSAALGMLLVLRERAIAQGKAVVLDHSTGTIRQVPAILNLPSSPAGSHSERGNGSP